MQNPNKFFEDMTKMAQGLASVMLDMSKKMAHRFESNCKEWQDKMHSSCVRENEELKERLEKLQKDYADLMKSMTGVKPSPEKSKPTSAPKKKATPKKSSPEGPSEKGSSKKSTRKKKTSLKAGVFG